MTSPVVTDEMVQAAVTAYDDQCEDFDTETQGALDMHTSAMRAAITAALEASGEIERLRAALQKLHDGLAWDWRGHPVGDLPTLREIARAALAKMEERS